MKPPRHAFTAWVMLFPWLTGFGALVVYPFLASLYWSCCRFDMLGPPRWVGLANYRRLAAEVVAGEGFGRALWNTFYFAALSVPLSIVLGVMLAGLLALPVRGQSVFRTLVYLPSVVPTVAASVLWMWLLDPRDGPINRLLLALGLAPQRAPGWFNSVREVAVPGSWSSSEGWVLPLGSKDGLVLMSLWGVGNFVVIYLAALGDVPRQLHEAAALDGAGRWPRFRHITLPLLTPVIFFNLVLGLIQSVQAFTQVYLVSGGDGAPAGATMLLALHIFLAAFRFTEFGYASAMAWMLFVMVLAMTAIVFRTSRHWVFYRSLA